MKRPERGGSSPRASLWVGCLGNSYLNSLERPRWTGHAVAQPSQHHVNRIAAVQEGQHWRASYSDAFERPANAEIASRGNHALFQGINGVGGPASLLVDLG